MKKFLVGLTVCIVSSISLVAIAGDSWFTMDQNYEYTGKAQIAKQATLDIEGAWQIGGVPITITAANLNSGIASGTGTLVSNVNLKVYASNVVVTTAITLPSAAIASTALPATIANSTLMSNSVLKVYGSNLVVGTGGTVSFPAASVDSASLSGDIAAARLATNLKAAISNLFTAVPINGTNFYMLAYP